MNDMLTNPDKDAIIAGDLGAFIDDISALFPTYDTVGTTCKTEGGVHDGLPYITLAYSIASLDYKFAVPSLIAELVKDLRYVYDTVEACDDVVLYWRKLPVVTKTLECTYFNCPESSYFINHATRFYTATGYNISMRIALGSSGSAAANSLLTGLDSYKEEGGDTCELMVDTDDSI